MKVNNYDFCSDYFYSSQAGFLKEVGDCGEYRVKAAEILVLENDEDEPEAWADIMFSRSTGKQYAVCGTGSVTAFGSKFYYKELEPEQYIECSDKYLDEFGANAEEGIDYLDSDEVIEEDHSITYNGRPPVIVDGEDSLLCTCAATFKAFYTASGSLSIAAYLSGCRYEYVTPTAVYYW